jgi:hypothetical protein
MNAVIDPGEPPHRAENLALRQELAALRREVRRPHLHPADQAFWAQLSRIWSRWTALLAIVRRATVIAWHRRGFAGPSGSDSPSKRKSLSGCS